MAFYEKRAERDGVALPIQCLRMRQSAPARPPRLHYHDYTELLYGTGGRVTVHVGEKQFALGEGDLAIIHINEPHDVTAAEANEGNYIVVKFLPRVLLADEQTYREYGYALSLMENSHEKQNLFSARELESVEPKPFFDRLMREWEAQDFGYELALRADVTHVFLQILRIWRHSNTLSDGSEDRARPILQKAMDYIAAHYAELTEEEVAEACGISRSYFSRLFKHSMRIGFSAYVNRVRMHEAERLLLTTDESVTDIAAATGFSTTSYFIDRFRAAKGITPARYRTLHK